MRRNSRIVSGLTKPPQNRVFVGRFSIADYGASYERHFFKIFYECFLVIYADSLVLPAFLCNFAAILKNGNYETEKESNDETGSGTGAAGGCLSASECCRRPDLALGRLDCGQD